MQPSTDCAQGPVSVLFGPQRSNFDEVAAEISKALVEDPSLQFIGDILQELPSLLADITKASRSLCQISGHEQVVGLVQKLHGLPSLADVQPTNVVLTPLTVISQILDFVKLRELNKEKIIIDAQGFCIGFLPAIVVACSKGDDEFRSLAATMIRVAVCIGALVDLDESINGSCRSLVVRWKDIAGYKLFEQVMESYPKAYVSCELDTKCMTITVSAEDMDTLVKDLTSHDLSVKPIALRGRFHHEAHRIAVQHMVTYFGQDQRFQLPAGTKVRLPLRSNVDGKIIVQGDLLALALESILIMQCKWLPTVANSFHEIRQTDHTACFLTVGERSIIPQSVRIESTQESDHQRLRGDINGLTHGHASQNGVETVEAVNGTTMNGHCDTPVTPIAIVGMAGRYPQADSIEALWEMIELGRCAVSEMPDARFKMSDMLRQPKGPFFGNYLDDPDAFDHRFFGISAREAEAMDPQQRLILQVAYNAMESAGYCGISASSLTSDIGCYIGVGSDDYTDNVGSRDSNAFSATGTLQAFNSGRISHYFGWSGPSLIVDTACSSAAVAIHLACKSLQAKECSIAMAGGVNVMTSPKVTQNLAAASFLSPTGASRAFDADANGYCRGEGVGLVILRPLEDALRDHDTVLAVIAGSAVNQGSNCSPITVPVSESQQSLYRKALAAGGTSPYEVSYVEAHGTGTQVGDPIEFDSIRQVFGGAKRNEKLWIGSIKDNIGHTETSSGVAALLKTVMMIQKGRIPKQANFTRLNPKISCSDRENISIPQQSIEWESSHPAAVVTNYGAAGSNAALLVKQYQAPLISSEYIRETLEVPVFISAKSQESLGAYCEALHKFVTGRSSQPNTRLIHDIAYNLAIKQNRSMDFTATFSADSNDIGGFLKKLTGVTSEGSFTQMKPTRPPPVILCFGGQTGNTASISEDLFNSCGLLSHHFMECENTCKALGLPSLFPTIFQNIPNEDLVSLHCILFSIQYASAKSWIDSGLQVDRIIGHSFGQLTGLCVSGALSLSDSMTLISERARLIKSCWGMEHGSMLSVKGTKEDVRDLVNACNNTVDIACFNGQQSLVVAGDDRSIAKIETIAAARSKFIETKRLGSTHGFHSRLVDAIVPGLTQVAQSLVYHEPRIPIEACSVLEDWTSLTPMKIVQHSRAPVYFDSAVNSAALKAAGPAIWLEAGSGSPVIPMIRQIIHSSGSPQGHVFQSLNIHDDQAQRTIATATANLWSKGVEVQFWGFSYHQAPSYKSLNLPPYQFAKTKHWIAYDPQAFALTGPPSLPVSENGLVSVIEKTSRESVFSVNVSHEIYRLCAQGHSVVGQSLCPASLYIEIILEAASKLATDGIDRHLLNVQNLSISAPLILESEGEVRLRLSTTDTPLTWSFSLFTQQAMSLPEIHATGEIGLHNVDGTSKALSRFRSLDRLITSSRAEDISNSSDSSGLMGLPVYQTFNRVVAYAEYFQGVKRVFSNGHEAMGQVSLQNSPSANTICDPVLVDNFLQVAGIHTNCLSDSRNDEVFVCSSIGDIFFSDAFIRSEPKSTGRTTTYTSYDRPSKKHFTSDIFVFDSESGKMLVAIMSATFTSVLMSNLSRALGKLNKSSPVSALPPIENNSSIDTQVSQSKNSQNSPQGVSVGGRHVEAVQEMFHTLLGIPMEDLLPSSGLEDIGVDSLMRTEVVTEIKKRFNFNLSVTALMEISDIQSLADAIFPDAPSQTQQVSTTTKAPVNRRSSLRQEIPTIAPSPTGESFAELTRNVFSSLKETTAHSEKTQWTGFCEKVYPQQMALVTAYVVEAFQAMGVSLESFGPGQVIPQIQILPQHQQVKEQLYSILEFSELVQRQENLVLRTEKAIPSTHSSVLHEQIVRKYPHHASEHSLLRTTGAQLAQCLTGSADPLAILFQDKEARELIGNVYTHAPMFLSATIHLTQLLRDVLSKAEPGRDIKILEIGAGTGGTTGFLLAQLADVSGSRFEYTFTDISSSLVALARKRFQKYSFMRYRLLNVDQDPPQEMLGQYDVIISSNCVHATPNIMRSTRNINRLLRPDGILCLIELTRNLFWFDLVFGLLEGWWMFNDGRQHALASEYVWDKALREAGYNWVDWSSNSSNESEILRLIVASPAKLALDKTPVVTEESVIFAEKDGVQLMADIYYPSEMDSPSRPRPIALMIHGGGHVMLSRKDIRPEQTEMLLAAGFLPVSIDYRLCPEVSLLDGPMQDSRDALKWAREALPDLVLQRSDVKPDGDQVVSVGWSTGGHLAMTLAWTATEVDVRPPEAILSFYSPTDYEDPFWSESNLPFGESAAPIGTYDQWEAIQPRPITSYNPPSSLGGWMNPRDARSRIALHMNWTGQTVPILLNGVCPNPAAHGSELKAPSIRDIQAISPYAQICSHKYRSPTFIIHGTRDDLIPIAQAQRTYAALCAADVTAEIRVLDAIHLFDIYPEMKRNREAMQAVQDGFAFLQSHVTLH